MHEEELLTEGKLPYLPNLFVSPDVVDDLGLGGLLHQPAGVRRLREGATVEAPGLGVWREEIECVSTLGSMLYMQIEEPYLEKSFLRQIRQSPTPTNNKL